MIKQKLTLILALFFLMTSTALAATIDISVNPEGDGIAGRYRPGYGWSYEDTPFIVDAMPNQVYHWYEYGEGRSSNTYMQFSLGSLFGDSSDILSVSLYFNLLSLTGDRDLKGTFTHAYSAAANGNASQKLGSEGPALYSVMAGDALGWTSFDVTAAVLSDLGNGYSWSAFNGVNSGYAGFTFSSAEQNSGAYAAFLRVITTEDDPQNPNPVPEPATMLLFGMGLLGITGFCRKSSKK